MNLAPDIYTLVDDDGQEQAFELLDEMDLEDNHYFALMPYFENPEDMLEDEGELVILKAVVDENNEELMATIDDDAEYERVGNIFITKLMEEFGDLEIETEEDDQTETASDSEEE